jgi:tetratricopeptide (TPR) repeat protein
MYVRRDYSRTFFSSRRRRRGGSVTLILGLMLLSALAGGFVLWRPEQVRLTVLGAIGQAPPPTALPSERATQGSLLWREGDLDGALTAFEDAVQMRPQNVNYLFEYGRVLLELDRVDDAFAVGQRAVEADSADPRGYWLQAAARMWGDPPTAVPLAIQGLEYGEYAPLYAVLGVAYYNLDRPAEALRNSETALLIDADDPFVQMNSAFPLMYVGRWTEAIERVEAAIALHPNLITPYFYLAALYKQIDQPEMAIAIYNRIIERDPDNARTYLRLCETYAAVEFAQFDVAAPYCFNALEIDPEYGEAWRELGRMRYQRRNYEDAITAFQECLNLGATDIECYYLQGLAHYWLGNCAQAWDLLQQARPRAVGNSTLIGVLSQIDIGLYNITQRCPGYDQIGVPTQPPPTSPPPTPIGAGY